MTKRMHPFVVLAAALALVALPGLASAKYVICIQATGSVQGPILGDSIVGDHQNWITALYVSTGLLSPIGPNGQPSGPAVTSWVDITTDWDLSTIKLQTALATQETFSSFIIDVVDDPLSNKMAMTVLRYELINASIVRMFEGDSSPSPSLNSVVWSLAYSQIRITDMAQGITVTYDWNASPAATTETLAKGMLLSPKPAPSPDPTQGRTEFRFALPSDSDARLTLFDERGQVVRELHNGWTPTEPTTAVWDGTDDRGVQVEQGVYTARLIYPGREVTQRITIAR